MIVLSCPEMWHLNNTIDMLVKALLENPKGLIIPKRVFFDKEGDETNKLTLSSNSYPEIDEENLLGDKYGYENATMPFLMAMYKQELIDINGYDEDFIGYAGEDNDLIGRLKVNGLNHVRTLARVVHLYHGNHNNSLCHYDNPEWVYNYKLLQDRMGIVKRNVGKKWGIL